MEEGLKKQFEKVRNNLIAWCHREIRASSVFLLHQMALDLTTWWLIQCPKLSENSLVFADGFVSCQFGALNEPTGSVRRQLGFPAPGLLAWVWVSFWQSLETVAERGGSAFPPEWIPSCPQQWLDLVIKCFRGREAKAVGFPLDGLLNSVVERLKECEVVTITPWINQLQIW